MECWSLVTLLSSALITKKMMAGNRLRHFTRPRKHFDIRGRTSESGREKLAGDDARALLGTPHGVGISYMLADHKDVLADRIIKMAVFTSE